jgi:hypothetical protein
MTNKEVIKFYKVKFKEQIFYLLGELQEGILFTEKQYLAFDGKCVYRDENNELAWGAICEDGVVIRGDDEVGYRDDITILETINRDFRKEAKTRNAQEAVFFKVQFKTMILYLLGSLDSGVLLSQEDFDSLKSKMNNPDAKRDESGWAHIKFKDSYAIVMPNGRILRHGSYIGRKEDITILSEIDVTK